MAAKISGFSRTLPRLKGRKPHCEFAKSVFLTSGDKDVWPSKSPDLNPVDYSVWSILEEAVAATEPRTIDVLKAWDELPVSLLTYIVTQFKKRLNACIKASGDHLKNLL